MIKIYTFSDKRPDFLNIQKKLFEKFVEEKYEFIVVNAASTEQLKKNIFDTCKNINLSCLDFPILNTFAPQPACSKPIQWCWDNYICKDKENISVIIDSDMFLINKFNFSNYLSDYDICADYDKRKNINYIWNGLMIFNPKMEFRNELNFSEGIVEDAITDVGGNLYYFFKNRNVKVKHINNIGYIHSKNNNVFLLPEQIINIYDDSYLCEFFEQSFFHYRAGSNWNNKSLNYHKNKSDMLVCLVKNALNDKLTIPVNNSYKFHEIDDWWSIEWPQDINEFTRYINGKWIK